MSETLLLFWNYKGGTEVGKEEGVGWINPHPQPEFNVALRVFSATIEQLIRKCKIDR